MTVEICIFLVIVLLTALAFITEYFSIDKIAFLSMVAFLLTGILSPAEAISGFSNSAVIAIMMLMILTASLEINNSVQFLAQLFIPLLKRSFYISLPAVMFLVGGLSAFISTTAVVLLLVKIMPELVKKFNIDQSKYMLPISYAGILGGSCTLVGTSTNLIANEIAIKNGLAGFNLFEISAVGVCCLVLGVLITTLGSAFFLKDRNKKSHSLSRLHQKFIAVVKLLPGNPMINMPYRSTALFSEANSRVVQINRKNRILRHPSYWKKFKLDDELMISADKETIISLTNDPTFEIVQNTTSDNEKLSDSAKIIELLILPDSRLRGKAFREIDCSELDGGLPLAVHKHNQFLSRIRSEKNVNLNKVRVDVGDRLLIGVDDTEYDGWEVNEYGQILNQTDYSSSQNFRKWFSLGVLLLVLLLVGFGVFDVLKSTIFGVALLLISKCLSLAQAYQKVNWQVIFLLVFLFPLGQAMQNVEADQWLSQGILDLTSGMSSHWLLACMFIMTMFISSVISNNATAIIITPLAIFVAHELGLNPYTFVVAVMIASNFSFFTPIGYQTNTIVYGMNIYKYRDFFIVGGILSLLLCLLCICIIPIFFPFG